jgi:hypothetical protein
VNASVAKIKAGLAGLLLTACASPQGEVPQAQIRSSPIIRATPPDPDAPMPPAMGTDEAAIRAEYGAPDFVRDETESQLWRYDGADCALFFFLYREADAYRLRHAETNPAGENNAVDSDCLGEIKEARAPSS